MRVFFTLCCRIKILVWLCIERILCLLSLFVKSLARAPFFVKERQQNAQQNNAKPQQLNGLGVRERVGDQHTGSSGKKTKIKPPDR